MTTEQPSPKPGVYTTEFWLTIVSNAAPILMALVGVLPAEYAAVVLVVANALYALSRGMAKKPPDQPLV